MTKDEHEAAIHGAFDAAAADKALTGAEYADLMEEIAGYAQAAADACRADIAAGRTS